MSFILDALKKAESERNRRIAPVLMDARVAPPRRSLPAWAWALGIVLVANLAVLAWLLLRPGQEAAVAARDGAIAVAPPAPAGPLTTGIAESGSTSTPVAGTASSIEPATQDDSGTMLPAASQPFDEIVISPDDVVITPTPMTAAPQNADAVPATAPAGGDSAIDAAGLPSAAQLRASGVALPDLELNLHIYDPLPAHRSVLLNGQRLVEGEYLPNGAKVVRITPEGVILEAAGRRFRVNAGG